ncbi:DUF86 domain-containing protein [Synergistaceae bacterium OttesenSCG-928-I11]|nr:DUF86 domain-containing protein [Synergistaceae bacterium OttesenSCG-928-I11]
MTQHTNDPKNLRILEHIVDYCDDIASTVERFGKDFARFADDKDYRNSCVLSLLQIGELAKNLTDDFKRTFDGVPWRQISGLRDIIAHDYTNVDPSIVWFTVTNDIPALKNYCVTTLSTLRG